MKLVIPGGSGQVGTMLARAWHAEGHEVVVIGRRPVPAPWRTVAWDARTVGTWSREIDGADVVVNLAGRSVNCRYSDANRREIVASRIDSVHAVGDAIAQVTRPPRVWLQMSTATIYAHRHDAPNDELTGRVGGDEPDAPDTWRFSIDVARAWEDAALARRTPATRLVLLRSAMVMSPDRDGVFDVLLGLTRAGLGGAAAGGRQYVSWIHEHDLVEALRFLIDRDDIDGAVNLAAPGPLPHADFMRTLRRAWGTSIGLPATRWMLEIGAWAMRTETELVLKSRRVVPGRLLDAGFGFRFPGWGAAAGDLVQRWRAARMVRTPSS